MLDDKVLALLGDREAAERLTAAGVLLECWRCGGIPDVQELHTGGKPIYAVSCQNHYCGAYGCAHSTEKRAIEYWNTRAPVLTPNQLALLKIGAEPRKFEEGENNDQR